jgi:hemolysin activation/secretion protein
MLIFAGMLLAANEPALTSPEFNVNSRYTVEAVEFDGDDPGLSSRLREEIRNAIGQKLNTAYLEGIARDIQREVRARAVTHRVERGSRRDHVKVVFQVTRREPRFEVSVPEFLYHSRQGWTAAAEATAAISGHRVTFGVVSDGDKLAERYAGVLARYENRSIGTDKVRLRFDFESYHQQWNRATLAELDHRQDLPGIYRTRHNLQPVVSFLPVRSLTLSAGVSFQQFQTQFPAARTQAANAVVTTLRYQRRVEASGASQHALDAGYHLRAATKALDSDFVYARHRWDGQYALRHGRHFLRDEVSAGLITGRAPLFDRFVLGNSSTLRGWNKFDVQPVGGDRMVHNSVEYQYRVVYVFYDSGAVWIHNEEPAVRHSVGAGLRHGIFSLALAFPLRDGRIEPVVMLGMNY